MHVLSTDTHQTHRQIFGFSYYAARNCKQALICATTTRGNIFRRTIKMASLMCTSLSLLVKVAPVSGQVKYTPDTDRHAGSFTGTLDPCKELSFANIVRLETDHYEPNVTLMVCFDLTHHCHTYFCCGCLSFFSQCSRFCLQLSFNCKQTQKITLFLTWQQIIRNRKINSDSLIKLFYITDMLSQSIDSLWTHSNSICLLNAMGATATSTFHRFFMVWAS